MADRKLFKMTAGGRSAEPTREAIRPHFADPEDTPRLTGQNAAILARLREGPAHNHELAQIALKYTSRISDIRSWLENNTGETITCERMQGGVTRYSIARTITADGV